MSSCIGHRPTIIASSRDGHSGLVFQPECGCHACDHCGPKIRARYRERAVAVFRRLDLWQVSVCTRHQFEALTRRLFKHGRLYWRIRIGVVSYVFHQPLLATRQHVPDSSLWKNSEQVIAAFDAILSHHGVQRISCSRCLMKTKLKIKSNWKRETVTSRTPNQLTQWLAGVYVDQVLVPNRPYNGKINDIIMLRDMPDMRTATSRRSSDLELIYRNAPPTQHNQDDLPDVNRSEQADNHDKSRT